MGRLNISKYIVKADTFFLVFISLFSIGVYIVAGTYVSEAAQFPKVVSAFTIILTCFESVFRFRGKKLQVQENGEAPQKDTHEKSMADYQENWLLLLGLMFVYYFLVTRIGFYIVTTIFLVITPWLLGYRKLKIVIPVAIITTITVWVVFGRFFYVPFPKGMFGI